MTKDEAEDFAKALGLASQEPKRRVRKILFAKLRDFFAKLAVAE